MAQVQHGRYRRKRLHLPPTLLPDPALVWLPQVVAPARLVTICTVVLLALAAVPSLVAPWFILMVVMPAVTTALLWALVWAAERRYVQALDRSLVPAVGRLGAFLRSGESFPNALAKVTQDLPDDPLKQEWGWMQRAFGMPLGGGSLATPAQVAAALAVQTPSRRQAVFWGHLTVALTQTQDVQARRVESAYAALQEAEQRRSEAVTEMAQMRYSGIAIGGAGLFMALYLLWTQWERAVLAYSSPLGMVVGVLVVAALVTPIIGGMLLTQVADTDY
jgi:Flp pilus assembly protein TadB